MPSLEAYRRSLDYSYAPGLFPSMEALTRRPELVRRVLLHSKAEHSDATERLLAICQSHNIRVETADRALARLSGKENVFAAAVFAKEQAIIWCYINPATGAIWALCCALRWALAMWISPSSGRLQMPLTRVWSEPAWGLSSHCG